MGVPAGGPDNPFPQWNDETWVALKKAAIVLAGVFNAGGTVQSIGGAAGQVTGPSGDTLTVKRAFANVAQSQTNSLLVAPVAGKSILVLSSVFVAGGTATNATFTSSVAGAITPAFANAANGGAVLPFNSGGWFQTTKGEGLGITTGAGSTTGVLVTYVEV